MKFSNAVYDKIKWIAQYFLPALGALYFAIAAAWNLPYGEQVIGTITAIDAFLGVLLGLSSSSYKKEFQNYSVPIDVLKNVGTVVFTVSDTSADSKDVDE